VIESGNRKTAAKQGSCDGLCGIYGLINALRNWRDHEYDDDECIRYLLEAAERLGLLTAHRIIGGFEAHEMIDIFNEFVRAHRFPARAFHIGVMAVSLNKWSFLCQAKRVFEHGGCMVVPVDKGKHWVLAYAHDFEDPGLLIDDPDPNPDPETEEFRMRVNHRSVRNNGREGVLILPTDCALTFSA
jgi:hypothetical protein